MLQKTKEDQSSNQIKGTINDISEEKHT